MAETTEERENQDMKLYALITGVSLTLILFLIACGESAAPTTAATGTPPTALTRLPIPKSTTEAIPTPTPTTVQAVTASSAPADTPTPPAFFRLTILHNNDGESQLVDLGSDLEDFGGVARFATVVQRENQALSSGQGAMGKSGVIMVSSGDNSLAGPEFTAGLRTGTFYDAMALDLIGYDAIALGNHDFDFGPEVLAEFIKDVSDNEAPFLSSNLEFSGEPGLQALFNDGRIAESVVVQKNGVSIGIIGATTPNLRFISSPRNVQITSDVAGEVQAEVDRLHAAGINKIVLISHLQDVDTDIALVGQIDGVDVVVAGGGDGSLAKRRGSRPS